VALAAWAAFYCPGLLFPLIGGVGVCWVYSARLKRVAIADVLMMTLWGGIMPSTGISLDSSSGWILVGQLALFSSCFETIQTLRDRESDARGGFATTAVFLGERKTKVLIRVLICLAAAYCILLLHYLFGLFMIIAALIPVPAGSVEAYWNRIRLILGLTWLAVLVQFYLYNSPHGLIYANILFQ
ncbi:MAG: UbiA family prenyltransferase, partial [Pseudomonadota bacterium]